MKNRTILGVICAVLALIIMFVVAPYFNQLASNDVPVVRLKANIPRGTQITNAHVETVNVPSYAIPTGAIRSASAIVGKYATSQLFSGDFLFESKLSTNSIAAADALENLKEGQHAISVPIPSFSGSLSGKLQNGDVVRFWLKDENGEAEVPEELQWVRLVTTTTGSGIDKDQVVVNADGSFSMPSTVTVIVTEQQAKRLVECSGKSMYLTLIYRGNEEQTQKYLDMQDEVLERLASEQAGEVG